MYSVIKAILLVIILLLALVQDVKNYKISNKITFYGTLAGVIINSYFNGLKGATLAFTSLFMVVIFLLPLFKLRIMGAGDIKLFGAIGAIMGLQFVLYSFEASLVFGALIALMILVKERALKSRLANALKYIKFLFIYQTFIEYSNPTNHNDKFPFTTAIVPGNLIALLFMNQQLFR